MMNLLGAIATKASYYRNMALNVSFYKEGFWFNSSLISIQGRHNLCLADAIDRLVLAISYSF